MREKIESLADAIDELNDMKEYFAGRKERPLPPFPFGLWFRGHSTECAGPLEPRAFRTKLPSAADPDQAGVWDETNLFDHLKLRVPSHEHTYRSAFDWLCLMQHYEVPTRLLDWSESLLPALYFAVKDDPKKNGELFALNAYRLNEVSRDRSSIASPDDPHVIVRAEMASTRSANKVGKRESVMKLRESGKVVDVCPGWLENFRKPVAVFPRRLNERMSLQSSVFTLHGGKRCAPELTRYSDDRIPEPITLNDIDKSCGDLPILRRYVIPGEIKWRIREELFHLGIHEASLFPEVDRQAVYLQQLWWVTEKPRA